MLCWQLHAWNWVWATQDLEGFYSTKGSMDSSWSEPWRRMPKMHLQYGCAGVLFTVRDFTLRMNLAPSPSYLLFCLEKVNSSTVEDLHSDICTLEIPYPHLWIPPFPSLLTSTNHTSEMLDFSCSIQHILLFFPHGFCLLMHWLHSSDWSS